MAERERNGHFVPNEKELAEVQNVLRNLISGLERVSSDEPLLVKRLSPEERTNFNAALRCMECSDTVGSMPGKVISPESGKVISPEKRKDTSRESVKEPANPSELRDLLRGRVSLISRSLPRKATALLKEDILRIETQIFYLRYITIAYLPD